MKKILAACFALMVLASCSNNDNTSVGQSVLVKKTINTDEDGTTETQLYTYNGNKIVKVTSDAGSTMEFTYTGEQITLVKIFQGTTLFATNSYSYNTLGELESYVSLLLPFNMGTQIVYTHNADGSISFTRTTGDLAVQNQNPVSGKFFFQNGEISRQETYEAGSTAVVNYTYDNKLNPLLNITGVSTIGFTEEFMSGFTHNILTEQQLNNPDHQYSHVYQYNSNDYPTLDTNTSSTGVSTIQYFYE